MREGNHLLPRGISVSKSKTVRWLFQQRRKRHALDRTHRTLRVRIELAQGFDGIAEKFETHRALGLRRKHVDDSSANRELAGHFHHVVEFVAHAAEMRNQIVERDAFFARERAGLLRVKRRVGKAHARGGNGRNHDARQPGCISPQRNRASFENFRVRRSVLPGQHVHRRKDGHFGSLLPGERAVKELQGCGQRLRLRARRNQDDHRDGEVRRRPAPAIKALAVSVSPASRSRADPWRSAEIADSSAGCRLTDARVSETEGRIISRMWRFDAASSGGLRRPCEFFPEVSSWNIPARAESKPRGRRLLQLPSRPATWSSAQSAPLTRMFGSTREISSRGVGSSKIVT